MRFGLLQVPNTSTSLAVTPSSSFGLFSLSCLRRTWFTWQDERQHWQVLSLRNSQSSWRNWLWTGSGGWWGSELPSPFSFPSTQRADRNPSSSALLLGFLFYWGFAALFQRQRQTSSISPVQELILTNSFPPKSQTIITTPTLWCKSSGSFLKHTLYSCTLNNEKTSLLSTLWLRAFTIFPMSRVCISSRSI